MEHLHHFGLSEDPFRNEPRLRDFLETKTSRQVLQRLERGLRQAKGLTVLTGDVGSGKTMVVRRLLENLEEEVFEACMLVVLSGAADPGWLLSRFASQLEIEDPAQEREALLAQVYEQLAIIREDGRHAVLIIDDAEALSSRKTLGEVCGLLKLEYEDRRLLSLVLAGVPKLERAIAHDPALAHRVDVKVDLGPCDSDGSAAYLAHRIGMAGGDPAILDPGAVGALHQLGRGLPGLMNTLADNALFEAFLCGRRQMTRADVERAHRDLGWVQGPAPAPAPPRAEAEATMLFAGAPEAEPAELELDDPLEPAMADLDADLEAAFESAASQTGPRMPAHGPPKLEEPEDLIVELLDD